VLDGGSFQMRPLTAQDVHALHALTGTPTLTETAERLDTFLQHWDVYGIGPWLLWRGQPDGVVGMCGIYRLPGWDHPSLAYVLAPAARGQRVSSRLLATLERRLQADGFALALLETGSDQFEAVRLYERAGYQRRAAFGGYPDNGLSLFFEKHL